MMAQPELVSMMLAGVSVAVLGVSAVKVPLERMIPPPIEGTATVEGQVRAGQVVTVPWVITKRIKCQGVIGGVWSGVNGFAMAEPMRPSFLPATGKPERYEIQTSIPALAPPGPLELKVAGYFDCPGDKRLWWEVGPVVMEVVE